MDRLLVQDFLRGGGTVEQLQERFAIKHRRHKDYNNLVLLKYSQIDSPMTEPLVRQCRGLILDQDNNWEVVCRPFDKFFNYGEQLAAAIDWTTAVVQEKLDGSLCTLYWYDGKWHVATSGSPDASGRTVSAQLESDGKTFAELFWETWQAMGLANLQVPGYNYMFELTSPFNRVVVHHETSKLTFLGCREIASAKEFLWPPVEKTPGGNTWSRIRTFSLGSFDEIAASFAAFKPLNQEGYVVVDTNFNRVKVKHPGYVALHHLTDAMGPKRCLELVTVGETDEVLTYFPEWRPLFNTIANKFDVLCTELELDYARLKHIKDQKAFALEAVKTRCSGALFRVRSGHATSINEYLCSMPINRLMELLQVKEPTNAGPE